MKISRVGILAKGDQIISQSGELQKRLISGIILTSLLLFFTLYNTLTFSILICLSSLIVSWEWGRIVRQTLWDRSFFSHVTIVLASSILSSIGLYKEALIILLMGFLLVMLISWNNKPFLSSLGIFYAGLPAVSLLWIKQDNPYGLYAILYVFSVVIGTDTVSYIIGRSVGGPKLAPKISPNKTWSGFLGGIFLPSFFVLGCVIILKYSYSLFFTTALLALLCQLGDLAESILKRKFQLKDSSNLIPGHGGFVDRVDGLIFAALGAGIMSYIIDPSAPAHALLFWSFFHE